MCIDNVFKIKSRFYFDNEAAYFLIINFLLLNFILLLFKLKYKTHFCTYKLDSYSKKLLYYYQVKLEVICQK